MFKKKVKDNLNTYNNYLATGDDRRVHQRLSISPVRFQELLFCYKGFEKRGNKGNLRIGDKIDRSIYIFTRYRVGVLYIHCKLNSRFYIGLFDTRELGESGIDHKIFYAYDPILASDFNTYGLGEFNLDIVGIFADRDSALRYRDLLVNLKLNEGLHYYGNDVIEEIIPSLLIAKFPRSFLLRFYSFCASKGKSVNFFIHRVFDRLM